MTLCGIICAENQWNEVILLITDILP